MTKYLVKTDMGYCGTESYDIVESDNPDEVYSEFHAAACESVSVSVSEATEDQIDSFE